MALSLGVQKGSMIKIGSKELEVLDIDYGQAVCVRYNGKVHFVTDKQRTELGPNIYVSYGLSRNHMVPSARLAFEAPREVGILRLN